MVVELGDLLENKIPVALGFSRMLLAKYFEIQSVVSSYFV